MSTMQPADAWVQRGFQAQGQGDLNGARQAYLQALRLRPEHPVALQLLGLMARGQGDARGAENLMRRSLAADPRQPHVWNNLGNLMGDTGRPDEALACFERAVAIEPRYADAHYNRAWWLHARQQHDAAEDAVRKAIACSPAPTVPQLQLLALIDSDRGRLDAAMATLDQALALAPERAALHHNRGNLLQRSHRHAVALISYERALALGLDAAEAHYNQGNALQSLGRHAEAEQAYRRALARQPGHALSLYDLARLRWRQGDPDFDAELRQAAAAAHAPMELPGLHAALLLRAERQAEAEAAYRRALVRLPDMAGLHDGLGRALALQDRLDEAIVAHRQAVSLQPVESAWRIGLATALLQARRAAEALPEAERACALAPADQFALSLLGLAWRALGDPRDAWLNDVSRLVRVVDLPPPEGFDDMARFNDALARELESLHRDHAPPVDQTLRRGTQTLGDIFEQGHVLVDALKQRITEAIDRYVAELPSEDGHPFLKRRNARWRFTDSWSSRLGRGGFHTNHVHPHGWLSAVCYVQVPPCAADDQRREGWLQFGEPNFDAGVASPVRGAVQPQPGRLVLFPSLLWHGTTPFSDDHPRLTIAFDMVPRDS
jgi:uncharacterized protein (TIGR02466 family)